MPEEFSFEFSVNDPDWLRVMQASHLTTNPEFGVLYEAFLSQLKRVEYVIHSEHGSSCYRLFIGPHTYHCDGTSGSIRTLAADLLGPDLLGEIYLDEDRFDGPHSRTLQLLIPVTYSFAALKSHCTK